MESTTMRTSKSIAQSELQQLKDTLRRLSLADEHHSVTATSKIHAMFGPTATSTVQTSFLTSPSSFDNQKHVDPANSSGNLSNSSSSSSSLSPDLTAKASTTSPMLPIHSPFRMTGNGTSTSAAANSKAVLSALKALQDKNRRLEEEKTTLESQCASLKAQLRSNEAQHLSAAKKTAYEFAQAKDAAHAAYEVLRIERDSLVAELAQAKLHSTHQANEIDHSNDLVASLKDKCEHASVETTAMEAQLRRVQAELTESNQMAKERMVELQEALHAANRSGKESARQVQGLEDQLKRANDANASLEDRLHDTEKTVAQMSQLNEKLVHNLWAKTKTAKSNKTTAKSTAKKHSVPSPRNVVTRSTAASRASAKATTVALSASSGVVKPKKKGTTSSRITKRHSTNKAQLEQANMGVVPFLLGKSTQPSFSVIGNAQEALRHSDAFHAVAPDVHPPLHQLHQRHSAAKLEAQGQAHRHIDDDDSDNDRVGGKNTMGRLLSVDTSIEGGDDKPTKASFMATLTKAINSVDTEFNDLNTRYKSLVGQVDSPGVSKTLERTIDELETKGEQLFLLKQLHAQASKSSIFASRKVLHSPDAADKKAAALRVLNDYRKLDRNIKTRSGSR
ncbi:hypothetical protein, variant [Aphanomyces invadans]|uniref:Cep57 centrosome localisation domain-containing protein n=1 Tax=Aphanomyces invadans TaxID=157072 RepID=A0A024TE73_9STRA|nr:hypothetical protein, variant [Aphanomyces invadans]ETV92430.1 hypothetical protein, variant [Aphanomyces invadans]|eukprot:XP_008878981.1 hypothetical protein, variant [Aphanomyces invadans]